MSGNLSNFSGGPPDPPSPVDGDAPTTEGCLLLWPSSPLLKNNLKALSVLFLSTTQIYILGINSFLLCLWCSVHEMAKPDMSLKWLARCCFYQQHKRIVLESPAVITCINSFLSSSMCWCVDSCSALTSVFIGTLMFTRSFRLQR
jgi:hypothetical protein